MIKSTAKQKKALEQVSILADRLMEDIHARNLQPGDSYMTSHEAASFLGVAGASANRALQLLEKRKIIKRSQKIGCVILEPPNPDKKIIDHVHFLLHDQYYRTEGIGGDGILFGIQGVLPTSIVSHCLLQQESCTQQVTTLLDRSFRQETLDAFVLVRASYTIQQMLAESGLPAIAFGGLYPGVEKMGQIDRDHRQAAGYCIDYLKRRGCRRLAVMMRQTVLPGDHPTLDSLHESGLTLMTRFIPSENECIKTIVRELLDTPDRPDGFFCHTIRHAECVGEVLEEKKIPPESMPIVVLTTYLKKNEKIRFPHVELDADPETLGRRIGELLLKIASTNESVRECVPVKFLHGYR